MDTNTAGLAQTFGRDGFVIVPELFSLAEMQQCKTAIRDVLDSVPNDDNGIASTGVYVGLAGQHPLFRQLVGDARLLDILEAIIGPNIEFLSDKCVIKDPDREFASPWHQDWPYWQGAHKISVWVALDDVTPENGCLKLLPGSHQGSVVHDGDDSDGHGFGHRLQPDAVDEQTAITAPLAAGGAVFFHDLTLHASHPNSAGRDRWVWIPTYRDAQADDPAYAWAVANRVVRGTGL